MTGAGLVVAARKRGVLVTDNGVVLTARRGPVLAAGSRGAIQDGQHGVQATAPAEPRWPTVGQPDLGRFRTFPAHACSPARAS
jgi:hypothetical protein